MSPDSELQADLDGVDAALRTGRADAPDLAGRELQSVALTLSRDIPDPDPAFVRRLDERVAAGFPRPPGRRFAWPQMLRPAVATLAVALIALAVAASLMGRAMDGEQGAGGGGGMSEESAEPGASEPSRRRGGAAEKSAAGSSDGSETARSEALPDSAGSGGSEAAPLPEPAGSIPPRERVRRVERSASLTLAAPAGRLDRLADDVVRVVDRRRGFVLRSSLGVGDEGTTGGSFELRVPARALPTTLRELSALATVRARTQSGEDITRPFATAEDRLAAARADRRRLLRRLEEADTDSRALALRRRVLLVSAELRGLQGRMRALRERTSYARVSVTLESRTEGAGTLMGGTGDVLRDGLRALVIALNLTLRALGVLLPLAMLAGVVWAASALLRRRRREAVLS